MSAFDPSGHAIADQPFLKDCRTCWTGQSLLASITRTREPSVLSKRACEQNSSSISETSRTVACDHPTLEQYHLAKFSRSNHLQVSRCSSCRAFRFACRFPLQQPALSWATRKMASPAEAGLPHSSGSEWRILRLPFATPRLLFSTAY